MKALVALAAVALAGCASVPAPPPVAPCAMAAEDRAWLERSLITWQSAETELLGLPASPLPQVVAIDAACTYLLPQGDFAAASASAHGGMAVLPDGMEVPLGPIAFASGEDGYFAMSLPSVWRAAGVTSEVGLERLMTGVLLHEMMHVRQVALANRALDGVPEAVGVSDDELTDDIVQERFEGDADYAAAFERERAALFAAAAAPSDAEARRLAGEALALMEARRARWFTGEAAGFAQLDDVFLTMEGMGQWLIHRYVRSPEGGGLGAEAALAAVRRGGQRWSQDEGLALMLVVDRLLPGWQARAFRDPDWRAANLLRAAIDAGGQPR